MKILLILRHAKSSWKDEGLADHERPLNKRGTRDAPRMGRLLADEGLVPDLIICSTARRATETAVAVADACGHAPPIERSEDLYLAWPDAYIEALRMLPDDVKCAMVVGHNPGLEALLEALSGADETLPTAALAHLSVSAASWRDLAPDETAVLHHVWRPKELTA